ncbi:hypothetical protein BT96DRAFT_537985 [Gymnopus androsaceus JB14]|uniref:Uncharacterized protein n=1 Tax=Gymnopus androsaceus JB14 TaxID=1447944 RepID=A0A6A4HXK5_9AGAR|nr:hypothetical protein BT96DRAFT_537985 [Gymnopus androsaceus JB14]
MDSTDDHHDSYVFYPLSSIFSATHSDAQARLNQSTTEPFQASDHLHEFEMAVYRLGQLRRGHRAYESEKLEEKDLGFSSRVEEELDGLHKSWEAEGPGTRRPGLPSSAEDRVEGYEITEDVVWKANYKKVETRRTAARTGENLRFDFEPPLHLVSQN